MAETANDPHPSERRDGHVSRRSRGWPKKRIVASVVTSLATSVVASCVIADPPGDLPQLPETRPTILRGSVVPSSSAVLGRWPAKFTVPVELVDPRVTFLYSAFVDFNPINGAGIDGAPNRSEFEPGTSEGRVRTLEIPITTPSLDRCHVVEVVVALRFIANTDGKSAHTPDEPGGDSVTWFFSPTGDLSGCPVLDAGIEEPVGDAEVDGGPQ